MNHIKQDKMFSTTTELDFEEYYRFSLQLVNKSWFSSTIIFCGFISIIGTLTGIIFQSTLSEIAFWEFAVSIGYGIYYRASFQKTIKKQYDDNFKDGYLDKKITINFYDNYLVEETDHIIKKNEYAKIQKITETENNFYIKTKHEIIIVQKRKCKDEEIAFIKGILPKTKN